MPALSDFRATPRGWLRFFNPDHKQSDMDQFLMEAGLACIRYILAPIIGDWVKRRMRAKAKRRLRGRKNSRKG